MPCALCHEERDIRNSHIIPEFLYEPLYDEKHRLQLLSIIPSQGNSFKQKGLKEHFKGRSFTVRLIPKVKLEIVVQDSEVDAVVDAILKSAATGEVGDGKIFVVPIEAAIRIRTQEAGIAALI